MRRGLRRALAPDESVVLAVHCHDRSILGPALLLPLIVGVTSFVVTLTDGPGRWAAAAVAAVFLLWLCWRPYLAWRRGGLVATDRRVLQVGGDPGDGPRRRDRVSDEVWLGQVLDVRVHRSMLDRLRSCGTIELQVSDPFEGTRTVRFEHVPEPGAVREGLDRLLWWSAGVSAAEQRWVGGA